MPTPDPSPRNRGRTPAASRVVLVNKPYGVLCQFTSASGRATLRDIVPIRHVYPAGRLDADSEGLVVLTGDGAMQARIAHPRHELAKRYYVQVEGEPSQAQLDRLARGVDLGDFVTRPANVGQVAEPEWLWPRDPPIRVRKSIPTAWLTIDLVEGRNRQVRRMTAAVGLPTLRLVRWSVGPWSIAELVPGTWRFAPATLPATAPTGQAPSAPPRGRARKTRVL